MGRVEAKCSAMRLALALCAAPRGRGHPTQASLSLSLSPGGVPETVPQWKVFSGNAVKWRCDTLLAIRKEVFVTLKREVLNIANVEFRLLGSFDVRIHNQPLPPLRSRREQWLLALLVLRHPREISRDWLAATLWPENEESQARFYLRKSLSNLRNALGAEAARLLAPTPRTVRLDLTGAFVDVVVFDSAMARYASAASPADALQEAVALYRGPLLPDCTEGWAIGERDLREQAYLTALETLANLSLSQGNSTAAVHWLRLLISADLYRESAYRDLMQALADCGDQAAVTQIYRDLRLLLRRDLNADPAPETEALYHRLCASRPVVLPPASHAPAGPPRHLPVPLSDLIGREQEVEEVAGWLDKRRLVTLVGTGGVGKTRLAIAAAERVINRFPEGVWFVDLASLSDPALVVHAALRMLDLKEAAHCTPEETLERALSSRTLLLVLDNCEHLLSVCAAFTHRLLSACSGLRALATSREALGLTGEHLYRVPSLSLPPMGQAEVEKEASSLLEYAAVRLFVERARLSSAAFRLTRSNAGAVVQICQRLDGIPLALEMAAARVRALSVAQIAVRLEDRFALLTGGSRAALPRQRTLQAAIDWSYDLLREEERLLLRRLSVFAGGWSLEAAEAVCAGGGIRDGEILDILTHLVEKSLVVFEEAVEGVERYRLLETMQQRNAERQAQAGEARYRLLETVRQYAHDRLRESEDGQAVRGRHRDYFTDFAEEARSRLTGSGQLAWSQRLEVEHDNLRSAIEWCRDDPEGMEAGLRLTSAMGWFWVTNGYLKEGRQHLAEALARDSRSRTKARGEALMDAALLACHMTDYAAAQPLYEECLAIRRELRDRSGIAETLTALGLVKHEQGDHATALAYLEERLAIQQDVGDRRHSANTLYWLGRVTEAQGDLAKARRYLEAAYAIDLEAGHRAGHAQWALGDVLCLQGEYVAARTLLIESLQAGWELGDKVLAMSALECLAWLAHSQGQSERAARLYGAADVLRAAFGYTLSPSDQNKHAARTAAVRAALGEEGFAAAWEKGRAMSLEQMVAYALA
jgi:non-specific serine/threonine protein kinase